MYNDMDLTTGDIILVPSQKGDRHWFSSCFWCPHYQQPPRLQKSHPIHYKVKGSNTTGTKTY